jgi:hypothetical protein
VVAKQHIQSSYGELSNLQNALVEIERLEQQRPQTEQVALKQAVANCQQCIGDFIERMKKFKGMDQQHRSSKWSLETFKRNARAVEWKLCKKNKIDSLRKQFVLLHTSSILSLQISSLRYVV